MGQPSGARETDSAGAPSRAVATQVVPAQMGADAGKSGAREAPLGDVISTSKAAEEYSVSVGRGPNETEPGHGPPAGAVKADSAVPHSTAMPNDELSMSLGSSAGTRPIPPVSKDDGTGLKAVMATAPDRPPAALPKTAVVAAAVSVVVPNSTTPAPESTDADNAWGLELDEKVPFRRRRFDWGPTSLIPSFSPMLAEPLLHKEKVRSLQFKRAPSRQKPQIKPRGADHGIG